MSSTIIGLIIAVGSLQAIAVIAWLSNKDPKTKKAFTLEEKA